MHLKQFLNENVSTGAEFILTAEHLREVTSLESSQSLLLRFAHLLRKAVKNGDGVAKNTNDKGTQQRTKQRRLTDTEDENRIKLYGGFNLAGKKN